MKQAKRVMHILLRPVTVVAARLFVIVTPCRILPPAGAFHRGRAGQGRASLPSPLPSLDQTRDTILYNCSLRSTRPASMGFFLLYAQGWADIFFFFYFRSWVGFFPLIEKITEPPGFFFTEIHSATHLHRLLSFIRTVMSEHFYSHLCYSLELLPFAARKPVRKYIIHAR